MIFQTLILTSNGKTRNKMNKLNPILEIAFLMTLPNDDCSEHVIEWDEFKTFMEKHDINADDLANYCIERGYYDESEFKRT
jgi:hypothetical protein